MLMTIKSSSRCPRLAVWQASERLVHSVPTGRITAAQKELLHHINLDRLQSQSSNVLASETDGQVQDQEPSLQSQLSMQHVPEKHTLLLLMRVYPV